MGCDLVGGPLAKMKVSTIELRHGSHWSRLRSKMCTSPLDLAGKLEEMDSIEIDSHWLALLKASNDE